MALRTPLSWPDKDPDEILDYTIDWQGDNDPVLETGETITTATWTVPSGLTEDSSSKTSTTATVVLSGGTDKQKYQIAGKIVTSSSPARTYERTVNLLVKER